MRSMFALACGYGMAPSEAKHNYVLRRLTPLAKNARVLSVTWGGSAESGQLLSPASAGSLLPGTVVKPEESKDAEVAVLAQALPV